MNLVSLNEVPSWFDANPFILTGYRPESQSWQRCFASWFYCHNESGNIFSHLIPALLLAFGAAAGLLGLDGSNSFDARILTFHLATAVTCMGISALYHTGMNHSAQMAHQWLQFDYAGILALILGNFVSGLHFGFYCAPVLKSLYWSLVSLFNLSIHPVVTLHDNCYIDRDRLRWNWNRASQPMVSRPRVAYPALTYLHCDRDVCICAHRPRMVSMGTRSSHSYRRARILAGRSTVAYWLLYLSGWSLPLSLMHDFP